MSDTSTPPVDEKPAAEGEAPEGEKKSKKGWLLHEFKETALTIAIFVPFWLIFSTFVYELRSIPSESMVPALQVGDRVAVAKFAYGYNRNSIPFGLGLFVIGDDPQKPEENVFQSAPKRGDVIVFQHPHSDKVMIKRLIGLPGDRVQVKGGKLYLNGNELPREKVRTTSYVPDGERALRTATEYKQTIPTGDRDKTKTFLIHEFSDNNDLDETPVFNVPPGHVFMMGDNRDNSEDSRAPSGHRSMAAAFPNAWAYRPTNFPADTSNDAIGFVPMDYLIGRAETVLFSIPLWCTQPPEGECPADRWLKGL